MATITTSAQTNSPIDMSDATQILSSSVLSAGSSLFSWHAGPNFVYINGSNLNYSGSGNSSELVSGTISNISIDVGNNNIGSTMGDLVITGTEGLIAGNIKKGNARLFWNEILKGDDSFDLSGLSEAVIGHKMNVIFGDDFSCPNFSTLNTDAGANDDIVGGDNDFILIGDVNEVMGGPTERGGPINITATYTGGNDTILTAVTDRFVQMSGDAQNVFEKGHLIGGNDQLNNRGTSYFLSFVAGDVARLNSLGAVTGGDDLISAGGIASGDVYFLQGSNAFVDGGNDEISGEVQLFGAGDVLNASVGTSGNTVIGGDDQILGSVGADVVAGDVMSWLSQNSTLAGGADVIDGGAGDDQLFGEVREGTLTGVTGGNDRLDGGGGDDELFGQTGRDVLLGGEDSDVLDSGSGRDVLKGGSGKDRIIGGTGNDRLTGGGGADNFDFQTGSGDDRILDFTDVGGKADDTVDVEAYNFASVSDIGKSASGDDLVLNLGGGNTITIVDYLATHSASQINNDIILIT